MFMQSYHVPVFGVLLRAVAIEIEPEPELKAAYREYDQRMNELQHNEDLSRQHHEDVMAQLEAERLQVEAERLQVEHLLDELETSSDPGERGEIIQQLEKLLGKGRAKKKVKTKVTHLHTKKRKNGREHKRSGW